MSLDKKLLHTSFYVFFGMSCFGAGISVDGLKKYNDEANGNNNIQALENYRSQVNLGAVIGLVGFATSTADALLMMRKDYRN